MIGCLRTRVRKQPIIALYFESENELKLYNLEAWSHSDPRIVNSVTLMKNYFSPKTVKRKQMTHNMKKK